MHSQRAIKQLLKEVLPGIVVFLDVDDLADSGALETYVCETQVVVIFVSAGYFTSRNCLRELLTALILEYERVRLSGGEEHAHSKDAIGVSSRSPTGCFLHAHTQPRASG